MGHILEVQGLRKAYSRFSLQDISFTLPEDCITGFIGVNGAGKTTTIRSILGLCRNDGGTIRLFGQDLSGHERAVKDRIGVVLDENCFYEDLTMEEMKSILAPAYARWSDTDYKAYMQRFSLEPRQKISTLSRGMRMKYALALALSHQADLLIMDEPTSGLDPLIRSQLLEMITDYMQQGGKGVFFSTHITSDLDKSADMLILIDRGQILFQEDKDTLLDTYRLIKGSASDLSEENRRHFLSLQITDYGFTGITGQPAKVQASLPNTITERPTIEDIMLAHIEGGAL